MKFSRYGLAILVVVLLGIVVVFSNVSENFQDLSAGQKATGASPKEAQAPAAKAATQSGQFASGNTDLGMNPNTNTGGTVTWPSLGTDMGKYPESNKDSNGAILTNMKTCPQSAIRGPDGSIKVMPGGQTFFTLSDYVTYLSGLYSNGSKCIPPQVEDERAPIFGVLGGLGVSAPGPGQVANETVTRTVLDTEANPDSQLNPQEPIQELDDYEYNRVFELEDMARNKITREQNSELMDQNIFDWANLPFNSAERAEKEDTFVAGRMESGFPEPKTGVIFNDISGKGLMPPDKEAEYLREQKILAAYKPTDISKHSVDSETEQVAKLVNKMYENDKNWAPVVTKTDEGQYAVTELRPKSRREAWEDAQTVTIATTMGMNNNKNGLEPTATLEINDRIHNDPFFDKGGIMPEDAKKRVWDYSQFKEWTPDLERMFAPTARNKAWY